MRIQCANVYYDENVLSVTLTIEKKLKRYRVCPQCKKRNAKSANFCRACGQDISTLEPMEIGQKSSRIVTKNKSIKFPFCKYVVEWLVELKKFDLKPNAWIFPRYAVGGLRFYAKTPLTIQRFNQILQRLDSTMTSCMFRYGGSEKYLRLGYTPFELKEIGDWSTVRMPEIYAERKGLTPSQKKFTQDNRVM